MTVDDLPWWWADVSDLNTPPLPRVRVVQSDGRQLICFITARGQSDWARRPMSLIGTKRTWSARTTMSAFGG